MTEEQKEDYRQQLFDILGSAVKEEVKTVPPISRMRKAEDHIMHFVCVCYVIRTLLTFTVAYNYLKNAS